MQRVIQGISSDSWSSQEYQYNHTEWCPVHNSRVQSQEFLVEDFPNHSSSEIGHVFLFDERKWLVPPHTTMTNIMFTTLGQRAVHAYLCECDWPVFGDVLGILACEHPTVTSIHLLRNLLRITNKKAFEMMFELLFDLKQATLNDVGMTKAGNSRCVFYS